MKTAKGQSFPFCFGWPESWVRLVGESEGFCVNQNLTPVDQICFVWKENIGDSFIFAVIDDAKQLGCFVERLRSAEWVALDTEGNSLHAYPQQLCLIQFSIPGEHTLLDPLAGLDLSKLWDVLRDKEIVVHDGNYDLRMLYRSYGFVPTRVFDTLPAARLLGISQLSLADLVEAYFGIRMDKAPQKANWAMRPLTPRMVEYAVSDTKYLKALAEVLRKQLETKGRLDWHRQLCDQLVRDCTSTSHRNDVEQWRIKGSARLGPRALAVLKAAWEWREREARARNQPPFFVLPHKILIRLAELAGAGLPVAGAIPRRMPAHRRKALLEVIRHAASLPEYDRPSPMEPTGRRLTLVEKQRLAKLRSVRDWQAARLGLDPALIASRATLIALARDWSANVSLLLPWQRELLEETPAGVLFGRDGRLDSQNV